jgi:L-threonylcarbamoyladenylate synthase
VRGTFDEREVFVLDGGACRAGIESTVLSLVDEPPRVLRPGVIGVEALSAALGVEVIEAHRGAGVGGVLMSPGLLEKHYAPRSRAALVGAANVGDVLTRAGGACVVISHEPVGVALPHRLIALPGDARGYAAGLYAALREADATRPALIVIVEPGAAGKDAAVWRAVLDRLRRATA